MNIISAENGSLLAELEVATEHLNFFGGLHGGCTATLVDLVSTLAFNTHQSGSTGTTVDMTISYLNSAKLGDVIEIRAETIKVGNNLAFMECFIKRKMDNLDIARASLTRSLLR